MKILHISPSYFPATYWGGPIFSVYGLNNALALREDVSLTVLTTDAAGPLIENRLNKNNLAKLYQNQEVIITRRIAGASFSIELLRKLPLHLLRADIVHLTATYSFPTIPTLALCRIFNKPIVWSPRGAIQDAYEWDGSRHKKLKRIWEWICNSMIDPEKMIVHATSEREQVATQKRLPRATVVVIPNAVDAPVSMPRRSWLPDGRLRLIYLGRISPKKGIENLLYAISSADDQTISLTIYGVGEAAYTAGLKELARHLGLLEKSVFFAGSVDGENKSAAFHAADVCIVPSHTENFCMVVAESLAHGVPVIASRGTPWDEIELKKCGLWVDNSPKSLAEAIICIRSMQLSKMGQRGRDWMMHKFSRGALANSMLMVYQLLISR
jgi:glycosyltransferase involved in cell wall biosynthesis